MLILIIIDCIHCNMFSSLKIVEFKLVYFVSCILAFTFVSILNILRCQNLSLFISRMKAIIF